MHQSRSVIRTKATKFTKQREERGTGGKHFEDEEDLDLHAIRTSKDILEEEEEESNAGC